jgi:hypothetical protein
MKRSTSIRRNVIMASAAIMEAPAAPEAAPNPLDHKPQNPAGPLSSQASLEKRFAVEIRSRAEAAITAAKAGQTAVFVEPPPLFHSSREIKDKQTSLLQKNMYIESDVVVDDTGAGAPLQTDVPVYVMLPLDTVRNDGFMNNARAMEMAFRALKNAGVTGVMIDVW